jgi:hypothetical protein
MQPESAQPPFTVIGVAVLHGAHAPRRRAGLETGERLMASRRARANQSDLKNFQQKRRGEKERGQGQKNGGN